MKLTIFLGFFILISSEILRAQGNEWEVFTSDNPVLAKIINTNTCQVVMHKDTTTFVMQPLGKGPMTFWKNSQLVLARPGDSIKFEAKSFGFKFGVFVVLYSYTNGVLASPAILPVVPDGSWADPAWREIRTASPMLGKMDNLIIQFLFSVHDSTALELTCIQDIFTVMVQSFKIGQGMTWQPLFQNETAIPKRLSLSQNYPNPFNPITTIEFSLPSQTCVTLKVMNMLGQEVTNIVLGELTPGFHRLLWDASKFPSGAYFYRLSTNSEVGSFSETRRMLLIK